MIDKSIVTELKTALNVPNAKTIEQALAEYNADPTKHFKTNSDPSPSGDNVTIIRIGGIVEPSNPPFYSLNDCRTTIDFISRPITIPEIYSVIDDSIQNNKAVVLVFDLYNDHMGSDPVCTQVLLESSINDNSETVSHSFVFCGTISQDAELSEKHMGSYASSNIFIEVGVRGLEPEYYISGYIQLDGVTLMNRVYNMVHLALSHGSDTETIAVIYRPDGLDNSARPMTLGDFLTIFNDGEAAFGGGLVSMFMAPRSVRYSRGSTEVHTTLRFEGFCLVDGLLPTLYASITIFGDGAPETRFLDFTPKSQDDEIVFILQDSPI